MENIHISKIIKTGSSYGIVLTKEILTAYNMQRGDYIVFGFLSDEVLAMRKLTEKEKAELKPKPIIKF